MALIFGLLFGLLLSFAEEGALTNVSLKVSVDNISPQVKCFVNESLKQVFPDYTLKKISYSTIQENTEPANGWASVHYLATHNESGKIEHIFVQLGTFDENYKWEHLQDQDTLYPFTTKASDFATTGFKGVPPAYLLLDACK